MILDTVLQSSLDAVPGCVFAAYIDLEMGMVLAASPRGFFASDIQDALAVAAVNMFEGRHAQQLDKLLGDGAGSGAEPAGFAQVLTMSDDYIHLFLRLHETPGHIVCYVCDNTVSPDALMRAAQGTLSAYGGIFQAD